MASGDLTKSSTATRRCTSPAASVIVRSPSRYSRWGRVAHSIHAPTELSDWSGNLLLSCERSIDMTRMIYPLMLLLAGSPALAQSNQPPTGAAGESTATEKKQIIDNEMRQMASKLGLSSTETAQFMQTQEKYFSQMQPLWQDAQQAEESLKAELAKPKPDQKRLSQLSDQLTGDHQRIVALQTQKMADLKRQLTPEQYAKLLVSRRAMGREIHQKMRGTHGGPAQE
jgi:Spy/CpxP family protein refolding chaperone